jgi:hypothetical protein
LWSSGGDDALIQRNSNHKVSGLHDLSGAFAFVSRPPGVVLLDQQTWLVLEICDGRTRDDVADALMPANNDLVTRADIEYAVDQSLELLRLRGLITYTPN